MFRFIGLLVVVILCKCNFVICLPQAKNQMPLSLVRVAQQSTIIATTSTILFRRFTVALSSAGQAFFHSSSLQRSHQSTPLSTSIFNQYIYYSSDTINKKQGIESLLRRNLSSYKQQQQQQQSLQPNEDLGTTPSSQATNNISAPSSLASSTFKFSVPAMETDPASQGVNFTRYETWVRRLYATNMFHPVKLGLENMRTLHKLLGNPMDDPNRVVVHVAGTNGKGSICLKIANVLRNQQRILSSSFMEHERNVSGNNNRTLTVGLFCSPHVSSFRERMQVNGEMITEEEVIELLPQIYDLCLPENNDIPATFFEITTALAFLFFAKRGADVVVLETGLGGRLDATNVVNNPALSIITSIGLEHTRILGDTIELIAREKGGIIKEGCPVLVGQHCPHEVLMGVAREKGAGRYYVPSLVHGRIQDFVHTRKVDTNMEEETITITDYDIENQEIAMASLVLLEQRHPEIFGKNLNFNEVEEFVSIRPPCRFEYFQKENTTVILDVAHNPPAMKYLVHKLQTTFSESSFRFVAGMSSDKDLGQCARALLSATGGSHNCCNKPQIHLVQAAHPRAASLENILEAESILKDTAFYDFEERSITKQVVQALEMTKENDNEILVVCGSVFLMAEAREALGIDEPRDSDYITEMAGAGIRHRQENFANTKM